MGHESGVAVKIEKKTSTNKEVSIRKINDNHPDLPSIFPIFPRADPSHSVTPTTPDLHRSYHHPQPSWAPNKVEKLTFLEVTKGSFKPRMNRSIRDKAIPQSHALYHRHACSPGSKKAVLSLYSHGLHIPAAQKCHTLLVYLNTIVAP